MNLDTMKHLNRDDFLGIFGLETRRPPTARMLPALALFGVGVVVGTGVGLLVAQRSGKELRDSITQSIQRAPKAIRGIPEGVTAAIHRATEASEPVVLVVDGKG